MLEEKNNKIQVKQNDEMIRKEDNNALRSKNKGKKI